MYKTYSQEVNPAQVFTAVEITEVKGVEVPNGAILVFFYTNGYLATAHIDQLDESDDIAFELLEWGEGVPVCYRRLL